MGNVAEVAGVCPHQNSCQCGQTVVEGRAALAGEGPNQVRWFALVIHQHKREQCEQMLTALGYEYWSPCTYVVREWSDRQKRMRVPLFPGYILCRFNPEKRLALLQIPGVLGIVGSGKRLHEIDRSEMDAIRVALASSLPVKPVPTVTPGQKVIVMQGPLCGLEGVLVRVKAQSRLLLAVTMLNRAISVDVEAHQLALPN
jgi:transcription termination/antitermination protein NusG